MANKEMLAINEIETAVAKATKVCTKTIGMMEDVQLKKLLSMKADFRAVGMGVPAMNNLQANNVHGHNIARNARARDMMKVFAEAERMLLEKNLMNASLKFMPFEFSYTMGTRVFSCDAKLVWSNDYIAIAVDGIVIYKTLNNSAFVLNAWGNYNACENECNNPMLRVFMSSAKRLVEKAGSLMIIVKA